MQTVHKRAAATIGNGHAPDGLTSPIPTRQQQRRRKKKPRGKPSQILEDWMAIILGFLILIGCAYWIFSKVWASATSINIGNYHAGDDADHQHNKHRGGPKKREGKSPLDKLKPMPFNKVYRIPESHPIVGDRSDGYAKLRQHYDALLPKNFERSLGYVQRMRETQEAGSYNVVPILAHESHASLQQHRHQDFGEEDNKKNEETEQEEPKNEQELRKEEVYDIYNCPHDPVPGYPYAWPILTVLDNWSPDDVAIPDVIYQGLCVFDFVKDYDKALNYRNKEVPFVVQNDPEVTRTVERWNYPGYIADLLKGVRHRTEYSANNHFMYALPKSDLKRAAKKKGKKWNQIPKDWTPPTEQLRMTYIEWLEHANITVEQQHKKIEHEELQKGDDESDDGEYVAAPNQEHWYFRLIGCGLTGQNGQCDKGSSEYLFDELPFFQPVDNLYMTDGGQQKGIHCRFGMKGVIAENHFDGSRNAIVLLGGSRRYILAHPDQCKLTAEGCNPHTD
jgi:hypothetical protein